MRIIALYGPIADHTANAWAKMGPAARAALVLILLLLIRWAVSALSGLTLHGDEAQYWAWSVEPAFGYFSKPPLIAWVIGVSTTVCGDSEACIRGASPLLHTGTAWLLYLIGERLFDARTGLWAAVAFATLPAVSFSSLLVSTDVPLLFCWAAALWAVIRLGEAGPNDVARLPSVVLGLGLGFGLLAKYAMAYFLLCFFLYLLVDRGALKRYWDARRAVGLGLGLAGLILAPNLIWNMLSGWATLGHTAGNANLGGSLFHPDEMVSFIGSQFGVMGPVFFCFLVYAAVEAVRGRLDEDEKLLLMFSLPVLLVVTSLSLLSRANANWAAAAYVAGTLLVVRFLLRRSSTGSVTRWLKGSVVGHAVLAGILYLFILVSGPLGSVTGVDPLHRLRGWEATAQDLRMAAAKQDMDVVMFDYRLTMAALKYQLRDDPLILRMWAGNAVANNHYEMAWPFDPVETPTVLFVANGAALREDIGKHFAATEKVGELVRANGKGGVKTHGLYRLSVSDATE